MAAAIGPAAARGAMTGVATHAACEGPNGAFTTGIVALDDGSLGWLACQIEAAGVQRDAGGQEAPLAFGFSWVELYARDGRRWRAIGNASSQKP
jgi:hypothetical protein